MADLGEWVVASCHRSGLLLWSRRSVVRGSERVQFMVVGNAAMVAAMAALLGTATTTWERRSGTLPFLIAAPTSHIVVFMSRSLERLLMLRLVRRLASMLQPPFSVSRSIFRSYWQSSHSSSWLVWVRIVWLCSSEE